MTHLLDDVVVVDSVTEWSRQVNWASKAQSANAANRSAASSSSTAFRRSSSAVTAWVWQIKRIHPERVEPLNAVRALLIGNLRVGRGARQIGVPHGAEIDSKRWIIYVIHIMRLRAPMGCTNEVPSSTAVSSQ